MVFGDLDVHRLCADATRAAAYWGAGWTAISVCLSLLLDSRNIGQLRRWTAIDVQATKGLIHITHQEAVVTLRPLTDDGGQVPGDTEDAVEKRLDQIRSAQIVEVACNGKRVSKSRAH